MYLSLMVSSCGLAASKLTYSHGRRCRPDILCISSFPVEQEELVPLCLYHGESLSTLTWYHTDISAPSRSCVSDSLFLVETLPTNSAIGGLGVKVIFGAQESLLDASASGAWLISKSSSRKDWGRC
jgi:hypothetical protein